LKKFSRLRQLDLSGSKFTVQGVRELHTKIGDLRVEFYGNNSHHGEGSVVATLGKIVLIRYGLERIAFKFTEETNTGDGGAKYVWYWQPEAREKFQASTLKTGEGEVFEKNSSHKDAEGNTVLTDIGGQNYMQMGPARLLWSKPFFVYYPLNHKAAPEVQFALTPWEKIADVKFDDPMLKWYERTIAD